MKLLLLNPPVFNSDFITWNFPSNGVGVISAYLQNKGYEFSYDDLLIKMKYKKRKGKQFFGIQIKKNSKELFQNNDFFELFYEYAEFLNERAEAPRIKDILSQVFSLMEFNPKHYDLVGFSVHSIFQYLFSLILAKEIKKRWKKKIVFGGPFITLLGEKFFERFPFIDYCIVGDGEVALSMLLDVLSEVSVDFKSVPGLVYRKNGIICSNKPMPVSIHDRMIPEFTKKTFQKYYSEKIIPYQTQRGCNSRCVFCTHHNFGNGLEEKSISQVIDDLKILHVKYGVNRFFFCDATINADYDRTKELCAAILKARLNIHWGGLSRAKDIDKDLAMLLIKAGCRFMRFGIETGSQESISRLGKPFSIDNAAMSLKNAHDVGIYTRVQFIVGTPYETQYDFDKTLEFVKNYAAWMDEIFCVPFYLEHNSLIQRNPEKYGITNVRSLYEDIFNGSDQALKSYAHYLDLRKAYAFDEIDGLKWHAKLQQEKNRRKVFIDCIEKMHKKGKIL